MSSSAKIERQWRVIADLCDRILSVRRLELGREFLKLRELYSDRSKSRADVGASHGVFKKQCERRGFSHRTVCNWIADFEASQSGGKTTADKQRERRHVGLRGEAQPGQDREFVFPSIIVTEEENELLDLLDSEEIKTLLLEAARKKREKKTAKTRSARAGA